MRWMFAVIQNVDDLFGLYLLRSLVFAADQEQAERALLATGQLYEAAVLIDHLTYWNLGPAPREWNLEFKPAYDYGATTVAIFETGEDDSKDQTRGDESDFERVGENDEDNNEGGDLVPSS